MILEKRNMDTEKRLGIKKPKAIMLFVQMILVIFLLIVSVYLLAFVTSYNLGAWMIISYIFITLSVIALIGYGIIGFKKGKLMYLLSVLPFSIAVFVNILLPGRETVQIALLSVLFALTFAFLLKQDDKRFTMIIGISMIVISLIFSVYSAIKADISFLGDVSNNLATYIAMYSSIFIPVVMSVTFTVVFSVRCDKKLLSK